MRSREEIIEVFEREQAGIFRYALLHIGNREDAADVCQEAFIRFMREAKDFESDEHIKAWLLRTTSNLCKNAYRSRKVREDKLEALKGAMPALSQGDDLADALGSADILTRVLALPEKYKRAIYLYYYEGYKTQEIASITDASDSTVRSLLLRARKMLKAELEPAM